MSDESNIEPASSFLQSLYERERKAPLPNGAEGRILSAVLAQTATGNPLPPTTDAPSVEGAAEIAAETTSSAIAITKAKLAAAGLATAVLSATTAVVVDRTWIADRKPSVQAIPPQEPADAHIASPTEDAAPLRVDAMSQTPVADADVVPPKAPANEKRVKVAPSQRQESLLIDQGRTALRRRMPREALIVLMRHGREFPKGQLSEERDVLIIEAYIASGNRRLATRRIQQYKRDFPKGLLRARVMKAEKRLATP